MILYLALTRFMSFLPFDTRFIRRTILVLAATSASLSAIQRQGQALAQSPRPPQCCELPTTESAFGGTAWVAGVVPYELAVTLSAAQRAQVASAMSEIARVAQVRFVPRTSEIDFVHVRDSNRNSSSIGRIGGRQDLEIFNWSQKFVIVHELMHVLGFHHEHQRPDRDLYVTIHPGCIKTGSSQNFVKLANLRTLSAYDFDSVMHYAKDTLSKSANCSAITPKPPNGLWLDAMGQRRHLSDGDIRGLQLQYGRRGGAFYVIDRDGDGKQELLSRYANGIAEIWEPARDAQNKDRLRYATGMSTPFLDRYGWATGNRFLTLRIDSDRRPEWLARYASGAFEIWKSDGVRLRYDGSFATNFDDANGWDVGNKFFVLDLDGDGRDEMLARRASGHFDIWKSNDKTLAYSTSFSSGFTDAAGWNNPNVFLVMDLDGDARCELLCRRANGLMEVWKSTGKVLAYSTTFSTAFSDANGWAGDNRFYPADLDGDGKHELLSREASGAFKVWRWDAKNSKLQNTASFDTPFKNSTGWDTPNSFFVMDIDGDRRAELLARYGSGAFEVWKSDGVKLAYSNGFRSVFDDKKRWDADDRPLSAYGRAVKGSGGVPPIAADSPAEIGKAIRISVSKILKNAPGIIIASSAAAAQPLFTGVLHVDLSKPLLFETRLADNEGIARLGNLTIPNDPKLRDVNVYWQGIFLDPGAAQGWSMTSGLKIRIQ